MEKDNRFYERMEAYARFLNILNKKEITPYKLSQLTGIATSTLSDWKNGKSMPKQDKMQKIADVLDTTVDYITMGKSPDYSYLYSVGNADLLIEITQKMKNDADFTRRLERYMSLLSENKKSVDDMIDLMYSKEHKGEV